MKTGRPKITLDEFKEDLYRKNPLLEVLSPYNGAKQ